MKAFGGAGLVVIGFVLLWLAVSGRIDCFFAFVSCITSGEKQSGDNMFDNVSHVVGQSFQLPTIIDFRNR